jgi:hypothetical protein
MQVCYNRPGLIFHSVEYLFIYSLLLLLLITFIQGIYKHIPEKNNVSSIYYYYYYYY